MGASKRSRSASTTFEISDTHGVVDYQTGEIAPIVRTKEKRILKYAFGPEGYVIMGLLDIKKLRKIKTSATGKDLALLIVELAGYSGICDKSYKELAEELNVDPSSVSRLVAVLEKAGVIYRIGGHKSTALMVNPSFAFRGKPAEHHAALKRWAEYHPIGIVQRNVERVA